MTKPPFPSTIGKQSRSAKFLTMKTAVRKSQENNGQTGSWCLDKAVLARGGGGGDMSQKGRGSRCRPDSTSYQEKRSDRTRIYNCSYLDCNCSAKTMFLLHLLVLITTVIASSQCPLWNTPVCPMHIPLHKAVWTVDAKEWGASSCLPLARSPCSSSCATGSTSVSRTS